MDELKKEYPYFPYDNVLEFIFNKRVPVYDDFFGRVDKIPMYDYLEKGVEKANTKTTPASIDIKRGEKQYKKEKEIQDKLAARVLAGPKIHDMLMDDEIEQEVLDEAVMELVNKMLAWMGEKNKK